MNWRVAKSLEVLRSQINQAYPNRSKSSDGTIGNAEHASRSSDHNPWVQDGGQGVVTALDITHDPAHGIDSYVLAERLRQSHDHRIKFIISNKRIASSDAVNGEAAWVWRPYHGANPHDHHFHVSVKSTKSLYDDISVWKFGAVEAVIVGDVRWLQQSLNTLGAKPKLAVDGFVGPLTRAALKSFQQNAGIVGEQSAGPLTTAAIETSLKAA